MNCLQCFGSKEFFTNYLEVCLEVNGEQATKMPEHGSNTKFVVHLKQLKAPFELKTYLNLFCKKFRKLIGKILMNLTLKKPRAPSYGYKVVFIDDRFTNHEQKYCSEDVIFKFIIEMFKEVF